MSRIAVLTFAVLLLAWHGARAQDQDLYSGEVPVQGQGAAERNQALPDALIQVLQKISGQRDLPTGPELEQGLNEAGRMLRSFQYRDVVRTLPEGGEEQQLRLVASFVPDAVDRLVRDLGLRRWRPGRKPIVIWPVVDDGQGRELMPVEYQYAWDTVADVAALRGLPIAWPDLSEELRQQMDLQLLWGGYTDQLLGNGSDSDGVVIIAARREGPEWNLRWTFADTNASSSWRTRDRDLTFALVQGIHQLTDLVASVNSIGPAGQGEWQVDLLVSGLHGRNDYARCLDYLQKLSLVDQVEVRSAGPEGLSFRLKLNAAPEYLERMLGRDGVLQSQGGPHSWRLAP